MSDSVRIDKWLWAVRVFKTRALATEACKAGHVKIAGNSMKAARDVRIGEIIEAYTGTLTRTVKVLGATERRVGAKAVVEFMEDLTPASELRPAHEPSLRPISLVSKSKPGKHERRALERFKELL